MSDTDSIFGSLSSFLTSSDKTQNSDNETYGTTPTEDEDMSFTNSTLSKETTETIQTNIKKNYKTAVYDFFKLKKKYEDNVLFLKKKEKNKEKNKEKYVKKRPKCINCGRQVGTIFTIKSDKYEVKCGDKSLPCNLNILITREPITFYKDEIDYFQKDINTEQAIIIQNKFNVIFGYITETEGIKESEKAFYDYDRDIMIYTNYNNEYNKILMSEERKTEIHNLQNEIEEHIREVQYCCDKNNIRVLSSSIKRTNSEIEKTHIPLDQIIEIYINNIIPKTEKLRKLKFPVMEMDNSKLYKYNINPNKEIKSMEYKIVEWTVS